MEFTGEKCIYHLVYLSDFFEVIKLLNLNLQGQRNILKTYDATEGFMEKISSRQRRLQSSKPNFSSFPHLKDVLGDTQHLPLN